jgi:penicillin-binding protein A
MPLDYKYSKEPPPSPRRAIKFLFLFGIFVALCVIISGLIHFQLRSADKRILTGQYQEALQSLNSMKWMPVIKGRIEERIGTAEILLHGKERAEPHFRDAESRPFFAPVFFWQDILKTLWTQSRYHDGLFYSQHVERHVNDQNVFRFYKAGFLGGLNRLQEAEKELATAQNIPQFSNELATLQSEVRRRLSTGQYTFLYDRESLPLVSRSLNGSFKILYQPVALLLQNPSGNYLAKLSDPPGRQASLTLDYRIQTAASNALGKYAGAIVLLDVENGDILAAASNLNGHNSAYPPGTSVATHVQYEPGSIIKMITLAGSLEKGANPERLFPMNCEGILKLAGNKFMYCWKAHGHLQHFDDATAVSCNVGFAKIGLGMKPEDLLSNLRTFGFDTKLTASYLPLELGTIIKKQVDEHYISNLSIGLDYLKITPLHAAMVSAAIANEGLSMTPRLLLHDRNIIGVPYAVKSPVPFRKFMSAKTSAILTEAMEQVVLHPEGTGRRAAVSGLPIAMKTGTAGEGATGYNAIIIGFAPANNPKVAFSVFVEHSGKAEFEAARITKLFLESIQGYIQ